MSRRRVARSAQHSPRLRRQGYLRPQVESLEKRSLLAMVDFLSLPSDGGVPPGLAGRPEDVGHDRPPAIVGREESDLAYLARRVPSHELPLLDKVNTQLLTLYSRHLQGQPSDVTRQVINNMPLERLWVQRNGVPQIRAYVTDVGVALEELEALGLESSGTLDTERWKIIEGYLPVPALRDAARITGLTYLDVAIQPHANASGSAANEWETVSGADQLKRLLGVDGSSIDIGVISDSFSQVRNGVADSQNSGDLPPGDRVRILQDFSFGVKDEGRAMAELMYDVGPGFDFLFHSGFVSVSDFATGIGELADAGADIIVDDVFWLGQPQFQQGPLEQAVNNVVAAGVPYFTSAGNHNGGSRFGVWSDLDGDNYHEFSNSPLDETLTFNLDATIPGTTNNNSLYVELHWDEWWGAAATDFNLEVWDATNTVLQAASNQGNVGGFSIDTFFFQNPASVAQNFNLRIRYIAGAAPTDRQLLVASYPNGNVRFTDPATLNQPSIYGHSGAELAFSIAAVPQASVGTVESFSSRGPKRLAFSNSGIRLEPTRVFAKPDFAAADQVATSVPGFIPFSGTSAAAPNAAAVAGLMLDAVGGPGSLTRSDLYSLLSATTTDTEDAAWNSRTGWGVINAVGAGVAAQGPVADAATVEFNQFGHAVLKQEIDGNPDVDRFTVAARYAGFTTVEVSSNLESGESVDVAMAYWDLGNPPEFAGVSYSHVESNGWQFDTDPKMRLSLSPARTYQFAVFSEEDRTGRPSAPYTMIVLGPAQAVVPVPVNSNGLAIISDGLSQNHDVGYYELIAPADADGRVVVTTNHTPSGSLNTVLSLYTEWGTLLERVDDNGRGVGEVLTFAGVEPGAKYVVRVGSRDYASSGVFQMAVDFGGALTIRGTEGRDDILLDYVPSQQALNVSVNGAQQVIPWSPTSSVQYSSVFVDGLGDNDNIRVLRDPPSTSLIVQGGTGDDAIVLGRDAGRFYELSTSNIVLAGGEGRDTVLVLDNQSSDDSRPYIVSGSVFTREGDQTVVALNDVEQINVSSNSLGTELRIGDLSTGSAISIVDNGGADTLVFGDESGQSLDQFQGAFEYRGALDSNLRTSVVLHDEASEYIGDYRIGSTTGVTTLTRGTARWNLHNSSAMTLLSGAGGAQFIVDSTQSGTNWTIHAGGGADQLQVTPGTRFGFPFPALFGGNLNALRGSLAFLADGGVDEVRIDDQFSETGRQYVVDGSQVRWNGAPGIALEGVQSLVFHAGSQADEFDVGGGDLIHRLVPAVTIDGAGGSDAVIIQDQDSSVAGGYVLGTQAVAPSLVEGEFRKFYPTITGFSLATARLATRAIETVQLHGTALDDSFSVNSTPAGQNLILDGQAGADSFTVQTGQLRSRVDIIGGTPTSSEIPATAQGDILELIGDGDDVGAYTPGFGADRGSIAVNGQIVAFTGLEPVYASRFSEFSLITPRSRDVVTVDRVARESFLDPADRWTRISGTSGVLPIGFEELLVRDVGTLVLNVADNDLTADPAPLNPLVLPTDTVTLQTGALENTRLGTFRVITGLGGDIIEDHLTQTGLASTTLDIAAVAPGTQHRLHGVPASVQLYATGPNTSRYEAFDSQGRLLHRAVQSLVSRVTLPDAQRNVQFVATDSVVRLDQGSDGRQRIEAGGATSWQFLPHPTDGQLDVQAAGHSTIMIIAILTPLPPELLGSITADRLTLIADLASPTLPNTIHVQQLDEEDELILRTLAQEGLADRIAVDLHNPSLIAATLQRIPDSPTEGVSTDPSLQIQVALHSSSEGPQIDLSGSAAAHDSLQVFAPLVAPSLDRAPQRINVAAIELLVLVGPHLALQPNDAGGVAAHAGYESLADTTAISVVVNTDSQLDHTLLDTRVNPSLPADQGEVLIEHGRADAPALTITPFAVESDLATDAVPSSTGCPASWRLTTSATTASNLASSVR